MVDLTIFKYCKTIASFGHETMHGDSVYFLWAYWLSVYSNCLSEDSLVWLLGAVPSKLNTREGRVSSR